MRNALDEGSSLRSAAIVAREVGQLKSLGNRLKTALATNGHVLEIECEGDVKPDKTGSAVGAGFEWEGGQYSDPSHRGKSPAGLRRSLIEVVLERSAVPVRTHQFHRAFGGR